jgi:peroxiredoxin
MKLNKWYILAAVLIIVIGIGYQYVTANGTENKTAGNPAKEVQYPLAPDFSLTDIEGNVVKLSDYRGKVVILDFWATWCPPCRKGIPDFIELQSEYNAGDLVILGISVDQGDLSVVPAFAKEYRINYPVLYANMQVVQAYGGISGIPTTFIIGRDGKVRNRVVGFQPKLFFKGEIDRLL